nr:reverse transcriptase domain-containing protein [Tanacetum cinerariifolium]
MVVKSLSPYNGIIGRPGLKAIQAVPSMVYGMLKFPTEGGIITICSSLLIPAECASIGTSFGTPREERTHPTNFTVALHPNFPDQEVVVGGSLSDRGRTELSEHSLNIREGCPPVRQKKRGQAPEYDKAIQVEVQKLVEARIMREVYNHDWLSNPVMVKKHDESWRMCVDFTNLNKACPQDCYALPKIDWKVESLCGYPFKCFLDAYKGYHQIQLAEADEEKTAFHTGHGVYCYTKMPFGLKNAGATYQRLMDKAPRTSIKGQILADFLNEIPGNASQGVPIAVTQEEPWTLFTDGSSCVEGSGAGLILTNLEGEEFTYALRKGSDSSDRGRRSNLDDRISELLKRRPLSERAGEGQVPDSRNGLLHEVNRSKGDDNGKQFADNPFKDWCDKLNITQRFASVKYPQSNGLVERANRSLGEEIRMPTYRTTAVDVVNNDEELRLNLNLLEERRELAAMSVAKSKSKMMKYYNSRDRGVAFKPGDFVYRSNDASHAVAGGKLGPKWEGPYEEPCIFVHGSSHKQVATLVAADSVSSMLYPRRWKIAKTPMEHKTHC